MNLLLSLNKKYVLIISIIVFFFFVIFFIFKFYSSFDKKILDGAIQISNVDVTEPRFSINSPTQKIYVTASEGNFVDNNQILLQKNVMFKSRNFSIETDNVLFDRKNQTAHSNDKSIFKSKNTIISSDGFNIYDNGDKIKFNGYSVIVLK